MAEKEFSMRTHHRIAGLGLVASLLVTGCAHPQGTHAGSTPSAGDAAAQALQARYDDTRVSCQKETQPAFLCSGLLLRQRPGSAEPWIVSPAEQALGAMEAGYYRADSQASRLPNAAFSAIVYYPVLDRPRPLAEYEVLCASPMPSDPRQRELQGCGKHPLGGPTSARCSDRTPPVSDAEVWVVEFRNITPPDQRPYRVCSFNVRDQAPGAARAFQAFIKASNLLHQVGEPFSEVRSTVMLSLMPTNNKADLPIEAFVYNAAFSAGPNNANEMQRAFYEASGEWRPVIRMQLPRNYDDRATFTYRPQDQAVTEP